MFGFGAPSEATLNAKHDELVRLTDPNRVTKNISSTAASEMGMICLKIGAVFRDYARSKKSGSDRKSAMASFKSLEAQARKILK